MLSDSSRSIETTSPAQSGRKVALVRRRERLMGFARRAPKCNQIPSNGEARSKVASSPDGVSHRAGQHRPHEGAAGVPLPPAPAPSGGAHASNQSRVPAGSARARCPRPLHLAWARKEHHHKAVSWDGLGQPAPPAVPARACAIRAVALRIRASP
jgi:hypothetical protein